MDGGHRDARGMRVGCTVGERRGDDVSVRWRKGEREKERERDKRTEDRGQREEDKEHGWSCARVQVVSEHSALYAPALAIATRNARQTREVRPSARKLLFLARRGQLDGEWPALRQYPHSPPWHARERVHITNFRPSSEQRLRYWNTKYLNSTCMNTKACIQVASNSDLCISRLAPQPAAVELREGAARLVQVFPPRRADGPVDAAPPEAPCVGRVYDGV